MGSGLAVLLAVVLGATQGAPAYSYTGAAPSGACSGSRVWIDALGTGTYFCNGGTWTKVGFPRLDQLANPTGDTTFTYPSGKKMLWTFTGSTDNAFSIHGDGAFIGTGDLVHIHKSGTGSTAGADALHVEVDADTNMTGVRVTMANATRDAINTNAKIAAAEFVGPLTGNASTASALAADPADCAAGQAALGINAAGVAQGCWTPTVSFSGLTQYGAMYANTTTSITSTASAGASGDVLHSGGGVAPYWGQVQASTDIAGVLTVSQGGTGQGSALSAGGVVYAATASQMLSVAGTTGQVLTSASTSPPVWKTVKTLTTATWTSSAVANTLGIVGTGATPLTSGTYAAGSPFSFRCVVPMTRPSTTNQPRYGIQSSGTVTTINATAVIGLAGTAPARTEALQDITALATAGCAAGCTANVITGGAARTFIDTIEGSGVMNASGTLSLVMAPSAAAAHTAQIGARCEWY